MAVELPAPPDRDELLRLLGVEARNGSIAAIRLLLAEYQRVEASSNDPFDELDELDQLATRRMNGNHRDSAA